MNKPPPGVVQNVYNAISAVQSDIAKIGISKAQKNKMQGYMYRGIDDVYAALAPLLANHRLVILPRVIARDVTERQTKAGAALFYVVLTVEYDFVSADDGSSHTICVVGEAMDSGDKATNKAMSAAYKYACFQAFAIPIEGDNDADGTTVGDVHPNAEDHLFTALMAQDDDLGLYLYEKSLDQDTKISLYNSFPDGHKVAMKKKHNKMLQTGERTLIDIKSALANQDSGSWAELREGMSAHTKRLLASVLDAYETQAATELSIGLEAANTAAVEDLHK